MLLLTVYPAESKKAGRMNAVQKLSRLQKQILLLALGNKLREGRTSADSLARGQHAERTLLSAQDS